MANCEALIKRNLEYNCSDPVTAGLEPNAVIINRGDIDFSAVAFDPTRKNVITSLPLKTGKKGYKVYVPGESPYTGIKTSLEKGTYRNTFTNDFPVVILDNDPDVCADIIDGLANGSYVVVFENKYKNLNKDSSAGDSAFQVMGYYQGLKAETIENDKYSADTEGGWTVTLKEAKVPRSGLFLYKESYTATVALFETLTAEPSQPQG